MLYTNTSFNLWVLLKNASLICLTEYYIIYFDLHAELFAIIIYVLVTMAEQLS